MTKSIFENWQHNSPFQNELWVILTLPVSKKLFEVSHCSITYQGSVMVVIVWQLDLQLSVPWVVSLCHECLSPLKLWVRTPFMASCTHTTLCDKICHCLATGQWFSLGTPVSSTKKTDYHDITEILLKVA